MGEGQAGEVKVEAGDGEVGETGGAEDSTSVTMVTEVSADILTGHVGYWPCHEEAWIVHAFLTKAQISCATT